MKKNGSILYVHLLFFAVLSILLSCSDNGIDHPNTNTQPETLTAVYVSTNGSDNNTGSKKHPLLTVQKAIQVAIASNLNDVFIASGTYDIDETMIITSDSLRLSGNRDASFENIAGNTVLNGNGNVPILQVSNASHIVLENITFLNGSSALGGGINLSSGIDITLSNLNFISNESTHSGAIYIDFCDGKITACTFTANRAYTNDGAIYLSRSDILIEQSQFQKNIAVYGNGSAIYFYSGDGNIISNRFNEHHSNFDNGVCYIRESSSLEITANQFDRNGITPI